MESPHPTNTGPDPTTSGKRSVWFATIISIVLPGFGHLVLGIRRKAFALLTAYGCYCALFWPLRIESWYVGYLLVVFAGWLLSVTATWNVLNTQRKRSFWWLLAVLPLCSLFLGVTPNVGNKLAGFRPFSVPSVSMQPTIKSGDLVMVDETSYRLRAPHSGDIVIFRHKGLFLVKRVIAVEGDRVNISFNRVFVNDHELNEPYAVHNGSADAELMFFGPSVVPKDELFVLGDNRNISLDSRLPLQFGSVKLSDVEGKPLYVYGSWTNNDAGTLLK